MKKTWAQLVNVGLRLSTLVTKMALTLYMARYLSLADLGTYGLVFGIAMILIVVLGVRLDYVVARDLVGASPSVVVRKMRDQAVFYFYNYLVLALILLVLAFTQATEVSNKILWFIWLLGVVESLANMTFVNLNSLERPLMANVMFFVRAGFWVIPVILLGFLSDDFRNVDVVLNAWALGAGASLLSTMWVWRTLPWHEVWRRPVDWEWIKQDVKRCFFVWLGAMGLAGGIYVDRFVVMHYLGIDYVGVATFYSSFAYALLTLVTSGVLSFAYPRLIALHRAKDKTGFSIEAKQAAWHVTIFATVAAIGLGVGVPLVGEFFQRPILFQEAPTFWLMLAGIWIRAHAETLYFILFARHQDKSIWLGNLLFLIPALGCNALFVSLYGFIGIGYGVVVAGLFVLLWRGWFVWRYPETKY